MRADNQKFNKNEGLKPKISRKSGTTPTNLQNYIYGSKYFEKLRFLVTIENKFNIGNEAINWNNILFNAIYFIETTINKRIQGRNDAWYMYRVMEDVNVRIH